MSDTPPKDKDFKDSVNLPRTDFPMKGNLAQLEPRMLGWWAERGIWGKILEQNADAEPFVLPDGPPYANGHLHAGHALNKVLKDIVVKYRNMSGRRCDFIPGWDTHGLPIEQAVEKRLKDKKIDKRTLARDAFLEACRAYALEFVDIQRAEFQRLGVFGSWEQPYKTLDFTYEAQEIRELAAFAKRGMLYRRKKPVYWCLYDQTALAEAEVEYENHTSPSVYVAFQAGAELAERVPSLKGKDVAFVIWTTTPWTLPSNLAVAVNPEFEYVFYQLGARVICVARELLPKVLAEVKADELAVKHVELPGGEVSAAALVDPSRILAYARGEELEHLTYQHPFYERRGRVILGEHVTLDAGTGLVHTAPGHGQEDYEVGLQYGLDIYNPVRPDGRYDDTVGPALEGRRVFEANPVVIQLLVEKGALLNGATDTVAHTYPHCWRCRNPVILSATYQWFIPMDAPFHGTQTFRQVVLEQVDKVQWVPSWGHSRIRGMLETRPDWTISRQRTWGVPICIAYCEGCEEAVVSPELMERVAAAVEKEGVGVWYRTPVKDFLGADFHCPRCGKGEFRRETDILDVWFDSACMFSAVLEKRQRIPADLFLEGSDQHRGWFHSSMLVAVGTRDMSPYKACLTHGFVVDGQGEKMSKSRGNVVAPDKVIQQYGAEVLRLWVAASDYRNDVRLSDQILKGLSEGYRKIRNTIRYALSNLYDFDPAKHAVPEAELLPLDRWALGRLAEVVARVRKAYEDYEFHLVYATVVDFVAGDLSAVYFDILKDRLYTWRADGQPRRGAQTVLYEVASVLLRLLAPVMSFTAEEAWQTLPGKPAESVFLGGFPVVSAKLDPALAERYAKLFVVRGAVQGVLEAARRDKRIGSSLEARVVLTAEGAARDFLQANQAELPGLFITSQVELGDVKGDAAQTLEVAQAFGEGVRVTAEVLPAHGEKCPRCWTYSEAVGQGGDVCLKCREALAA
ncbi:isoleucine--tRNA ligase [Myxococcus xanthus]|uniref:isoleucine--tRNA ligase n=1 Tax=Myxococcus xanthus TaxID=34 RepID=UPI00112BC26E|nr:isoleucine--tRNA ligase [Myxococcus xanthus]QDE94703.1 isoleucine--tRNA ligase [Myxococcus xanthus]QDF01937.1 isoleucine--tRNA ligase [Myxococcus xanthus]